MKYGQVALQAEALLDQNAALKAENEKLKKPEPEKEE